MSLYVSVQLETSPGVLLELDNPSTGYEIGGGSFATRTHSAKQHTVGDDLVWLRGSMVTATAPGNVTEALEVWVTGTDHFDFDTKVQAVLTALTEQLTYRIIRTIENSQMTWHCLPCSQITVVTQREYLWSITGMIQAQVPRLPDVALAAV